MNQITPDIQSRMLRLGYVIYAVFVVMVGLVLFYLHTQTIDKGQQLVKSYAQVMAEQTSRVFDATEQRMLLTQLRLERPGGPDGLDKKSALAVLQDQLQGQPYLLAMGLLDRNGRVVIHTQPEAAGVSLADRPLYRQHLGRSETSFFVEAPVISERTGQWQLSVSRDWRSASGALQGVLVAVIDPAHFKKMWRDVNLNHDGSVSLLKLDGTLLMRSPFDATMAATSFSHTPLFKQHLPQAPDGLFAQRSPVDGVYRIFAYQPAGERAGLVLITGLSYDTLLQTWRRLAWISSVILLMGGVGMVWLIGSWQRAMDESNKARQKAQVSEHALQAISQGVLIANPERLTESVNAAFEALTGYQSEDLVGHSCKMLQGPLTDAATAATIRTALNAGQPFAGEILNYRKDGSVFWNELSISPVLDAHGGLTHFVGIQRDITQRKTQQLQLRLTEQVFNQAREGITITDSDCNILRINRAFTEITGYTEAEVLGRNPRILASGLQDKTYYKNMWEALVGQGVWSGEIYNRNKDGVVYPEWLTISVIRDDEGKITNYLGSFSDLSQVRSAENRLQHLTHFDPLTGLPNRTLLQDRTAHGISMVQRAKEPLCMMLISVDHFKTLNDSMGHKIGDGLLVEIALRLSQAVRDQDTVSHHAGKEFTLLLPGTSAEGAVHLASELLWKLAQSYGVAGHQITITASIGISVFPDNGCDFDTLFESAEIALHRAQASGRDDFKFYSEEMYQEVLARENMTKALRVAAARGELQVMYQPLGDMQTGKISGMEALLRWHHPDFGTVSPTVFIPLAEETGLIRGIGEWVLRQVCTDLRTWLDQGLDAPHVAVNVSPVQFRDPAFIDSIQLALSDHGVEPGRIYLEVTESALMDDVQRCEDILRTLKKLGFFLSLDDFGTGYSSLSYLKRYPFDKVKIDQSFVRDIGSNPTDSVIVKVIISMAHGLGLKVVAEGVETETQCEIMRANVCDEIQGYFFSRPVDAQALGELLASKKQLPAHLLRFRIKQRTLLLVDDEPNVLASLKRLLRRDGHTIVTADCGAAGLAVLAKQKVDVIISDQRMPGMTGVEFLREAKLKYPDTIRIVLSGYTELQSVTDAINEGAIYRFLTKPWDDDQLREQIEKAFEHKELLEENQQLDIKIRTTNQELLAANRHLGEVIHFSRQQIEIDAVSLAIVQEAFQCISIPVLGLDDELVIVFSNSAAESLFAPLGPLLGAELQHLSSALAAAVNAAQDGHLAMMQMAGTAFEVRWSAMGQRSRSRGKLLTMIPKT